MLISLLFALINTKWAGRLEKSYLQNLPVYIDGTHNVGGAEKLADFLSFEKKNTWLIIGMLKNKDLILILKTLKKYISGVIAIRIPGEKNSFTTQDIFNVCNKLKIICVKKNNIKSAQNYIIKQINTERIVITGSLYLIGKIRRLFI